MFEFTYSGGAYTKNKHKNEKFLLFFIANEHEIPFFQLYKNGIIKHEKPNPINYSKGIKIGPISEPLEPNHNYSSPYKYLKIFLYQGGYETVTMIKSIYFKIDPDSAFKVKITPFSLDETGYIFSARGRFLKDQEVIKLFPKNSPELKWFNVTNQLPVETLRSIITVKKEIKMPTRMRQVRNI